MAAAELTEEAVEAVEVMTDVAEELIENLTRVKISYAALGAAAGLAAGVIAGYAIARVVMNQHLAERVNAEVEAEFAQLRAHFAAKEAARKANEEKPDLAEKVQELGYASREPDALEQVEAEQINAFDKDEPQPEPEDPWNQQAEMAKRGAIHPYVIHKDEFVVNDEEHEQVTLTYFMGDDVLSDERDTVIAEPDVIVGLDNLQRFGDGSEDPNIVYIRNPRLEVDYEVIRSEGTFAQEVHGFSGDDLQHSERRRRRVRFDDERPL